MTTPFKKKDNMMNIKQGNYAELWTGEKGTILETSANKVHLLLESGKRTWESNTDVQATVDVYTEKEAKFLQGKDRLAKYKKKAGLPNDFGTKYKIDDILKPVDSEDDTQLIYIRDINQEDKTYILEARHLDESMIDKSVSNQYGTRYALPISKVDKDKKLRIFSNKLSIESGCPQKLVSVANLSNGHVGLKFSNNINTVYTKEGQLVSTNATNKQFSKEYKKEFGQMVNKLGSKKLKELLAGTKRITAVNVDDDNNAIMAVPNAEWSNQWDIVTVAEGEPVTRITALPNVYPYESSLSCAYEHPEGITLGETALKDSGIPKESNLGKDASKRLANKIDNLSKKANTLPNIVVFDNGGRTIDQYTIIDTDTGDIYTASADPFHPQGVGGYSHTEDNIDNYVEETIDDNSAGTQVVITAELPEPVQKYISHIMTGDETTAAKKTSDKNEDETIKQEFESYMEEIGATKPGRLQYDYNVETVAGPLGVSFHSPKFIATQFANLEKAKEESILSLDAKNSKWNFHASNADVQTNLEWFKQELSKILGTEKGEPTPEEDLSFLDDWSKDASYKRIAKKAARLGNYDFDVHGGKNWELEDTDGKQKINRVKK